MVNIQILVVEDESVVALDICKTLIALHYDVTAMASTGEEAIDQAASKRPDLVLMDIKLAGTMSGIEAAEEIQRRFNIPVIYLTAHSDSSTLQQAQISEPYGYCLKPFDEAELRVAIEMALYKHKKITERKRADAALMQTLHSRALRDSLTGLYNRRYMEVSLSQQLHRARRHGTPLGLIMLDVDHFKRFNDQFGHAAGDRILRKLGSLLANQFRGEDVVCRYGGDEFLIILSDASLDSVQQAAERLRAEIRHMNIEHDRQVLGPPTLSLGVVVFPNHGSTAEVLLRNADAALYRAKACGRDQAVVGENEKCRAPRPPLDLGPGQPDDQRKPGQKERITRSCETRARTGLRRVG